MDLADCDREPIHIPSAIQPHGTLLVVDPASDRIVQVGSGTETALRSSRPLLDLQLADVLGITAEVIADAILSTDPAYISSLIPDREIRGNIDVTAHRSGGLIIIEIEPANTARPSAAHMLGRVRSISAGLEAAPDLLQTCRYAAHELRRLTGFTRVMIYRFLEDGSGCVIAEDKEAELPTFLNHHYPTSDIPKQARELYIRNVVRVIPDVNYTPAPIAPQICPATGGALDMRDCTLRSVSPIHIQYLKNMNVRASMSVSIVRDGTLWGLVACHHTSPKLVSYEIREVCKHVAQILSQQIATREETETLRQEHLFTAARLELIYQLSHTEEPVDEALRARASKLLEFIPSDGLAVYAHGVITTAGHCPDCDQLRELSNWLLRAKSPPLYATDRFSESFAPAEAYRMSASGLLSIIVSVGAPLVLLWFRAERAEIVNWAGNPHKPVETGPRPGVLTPRASFDLWCETVRGHSRPWTKAEVEAAQRFQNQLVDISQHRRVARLNSMLQQKIAEADRLMGQKDLLMREMHHRVQNSLQLVSAMLRLQQREFSDPVVHAKLEEMQQRILAMAAVHRHLWQSTEIGIVRFDIYVGEIRDSLVKSWGTEWDEHVQLQGTSVLMPTDKAIVLGLIITELLTNAVKYAYGGEPGPIQILLSEEPQRGIQIVIADCGIGMEETRHPDGFGSRLTRLLVSQLGGTIELQNSFPGTRVVLSVPHAPQQPI
jgi:two-component system, chemotaxis family, sensor kinase Cph1